MIKTCLERTGCNLCGFDIREVQYVLSGHGVCHIDVIVIHALGSVHEPRDRVGAILVERSKDVMWLVVGCTCIAGYIQITGTLAILQTGVTVDIGHVGPITCPNTHTRTALGGVEGIAPPTIGFLGGRNHFLIVSCFLNVQLNAAGGIHAGRRAQEETNGDVMCGNRCYVECAGSLTEIVPSVLSVRMHLNRVGTTEKYVERSREGSTADIVACAIYATTAWIHDSYPILLDIRAQRGIPCEGIRAIGIECSVDVGRYFRRRQHGHRVAVNGQSLLHIVRYVWRYSPNDLH